MGVSTTPDRLGAPLPPGASQDALLRRASDEFQEKGFIVARLDKLVNWARTGSLWPMTFGQACSAAQLIDTGNPMNASPHHCTPATPTSCLPTPARDLNNL